MTDVRRDDVVKLEESLRQRLRYLTDGQFRLMSRGTPRDMPERLEALWDRLVMEGPGVEMIRTIVEAYEGFTADAMRRDAIWARLVPIIDGADDVRLTSLEQLLSMFEKLDVRDEVVGKASPRKRTDCAGCGAEIRYETPSLNTDQPEPGRGWVHVSDDRVECDTGEGIATPPEHGS